MCWLMKSAEPAALYSLDDELIYTVQGDTVNIGKCPAEKTLAKETPITGKIGFLGAPASTDLEQLRHYFAAMSAPPINITGGTLTGDGIAGHIDGKSGAVELSFEALALHAYLCLQMDGLRRTGMPGWWMKRSRRRTGGRWRRQREQPTLFYCATVQSTTSSGIR